MKLCLLCKIILNDDNIVFIGDKTICKICDDNLEMF